MPRNGAAPPCLKLMPSIDDCSAVSMMKKRPCGPLRIAPLCVSTRRGLSPSYFRDASSARLMMICIVPVGKTRSRSWDCTSPSYRQRRSTNGRSAGRGMMRSMVPRRGTALSGATALAVVAFGGGEKVRDVAVDLRVEGEADVRAGHLHVGTVFIDAAAPVHDAVRRRIDS